MLLFDRLPLEFGTYFAFCAGAVGCLVGWRNVLILLPGCKWYNARAERTKVTQPQLPSSLATASPKTKATTLWTSTMMMMMTTTQNIAFNFVCFHFKIGILCNSKTIKPKWENGIFFERKMLKWENWQWYKIPAVKPYFAISPSVIVFAIWFFFGRRCLSDFPGWKGLCTQITIFHNGNLSRQNQPPMLLPLPPFTK